MGSTVQVSAGRIGTLVGPLLNSLLVVGDDGPDTVDVTNGVQFGAAVALILGDGGNTVNITNATLVALVVVTNNGVTGISNDVVRLTNVTILSGVAITLGAGTDQLHILGTSVLPNPALGGLYAIDGGAGLDRLVVDLGVLPPGFPRVNFEIFV
jgi:hypothetical protein